MRFLRTNTAVRVTVGPFFDKTDGVTPETGITVTSCKLTLMVDDANVPTLVLDTAPTASGGANDMVHVTGDDAGFYDLELAAANVNYLGRAMLAITDAAVHCPVFHEFMILPAMIYDSLVLGTDRLDTNVTHVGDTAQTAGDIIGDTNDIQTRLPSALGANGNIKSDVRDWLGTAVTAPTVAGTPKVDVDLVDGFHDGAAWIAAQAWAGTAQTGTLSATQATTDLTGLGDDVFNHRWALYVNTGARASQVAVVTDYVSATGLFTFAPALTGAMANGDTFFLLPIASGLAVGDRTGTVATVTNLTNAPTSGDFTATMKTSLNTALDTHDGPDLPTGSVATDGGNSATAFKTDRTESTNDYWKDALLLLTSGAMVGQLKKVTAYNGTTKVITVSGGFTATPADGVTFVLINR